ncbi:hypothetical protein EYF80_051795 [Liparis tanakae]|uniref:Uncharacterized protein n=1 Tax=Liparis tanakae TaxID=230148 RepID=A0A4Z2FB98_9TELE|nr:hypothetical protein EYF80_051795 [Liparis tanakae]
MFAVTIKIDTETVSLLGRTLPISSPAASLVSRGPALNSDIRGQGLPLPGGGGGINIASLPKRMQQWTARKPASIGGGSRVSICLPAPHVLLLLVIQMLVSDFEYQTGRVAAAQATNMRRGLEGVSQLLPEQHLDGNRHGGEKK